MNVYLFHVSIQIYYSISFISHCENLMTVNCSRIKRQIKSLPHTRSRSTRASAAEQKVKHMPQFSIAAGSGLHFPRGLRKSKQFFDKKDEKKAKPDDKDSKANSKPEKNPPNSNSRRSARVKKAGK